MIQAFTTFTAKGSRSFQEDAVLSSPEKGIFVVADGFGGPLPGAAASKNACEAVRGFLIKEAGDLEATMPFVLRSYYSLAGNVLFNALIHANRRLLTENQQKGVHERGGASVLAGFVDGNLLALANVGVCTAWLFRDGKAKELVMPRTYDRLYNPFAQGDAREMNSAPGVPLTALGISEDMEPEIFEYRVQSGDWLLLHTDGVGAVSREKIFDLYARKRQTSQQAEHLVQEATQLLAQDSYTDNGAAAIIVF